METFEKAVRSKLRFESTKGQMSVEDLWDLSLTSLDAMAVATNRKLKDAEETVSFITNTPRKNSELELKMEILKRVIEVKVAEQEASKTKAQRSQELELLKNLRADKKMEALKNLSEADIEKRIAELG